jgi:hypothetical protein
MKTFCFDLDNTLCISPDDDYSNSKPIESRIEHVNSLFDEGHRILVHTARGSLTGLDLEELTQSQLRAWGLKYHGLHMGKPFADVYVDDKAILDVDFFEGSNF